MPFITQGKTNLKYILIVVVLAVAVGGGILAYQYWLAPEGESKVPEVRLPTAKTPEEVAPKEELPPEDETTNWKVYTNTKYGYTIGYPGRVNVTERKDLEGKGFEYFEGELVDVVAFEYPYLKPEEVIGETEAEKIQFILAQGNLTVEIEVVKGLKRSVKEWAERSAELTGASIGGVTFEEFSLAGVEGYKAIYGGILGTDVILKHNDSATIVQIRERRLFSPKTDEQLAIFNQMLSTFKFIE